MMTSVTYPSTSAPLHGGYSTVAEETTSSEPDFETPRPVKRCSVAPLTDSCKKRRKQSTPVRISSAELETVPNEGKPSSSSSPGPDLQCPVCQLYFNNIEQIQNHIATDHSTIECKKEPDDFNLTTTQHYERVETPLELTTGRQEQWMNEMQNKDWMNPTLHGLSFNPSNSIFMTLPQFTQPDSMPRQPIRIFNPDAYCDLCNKEFCNKYFLKTHKANKHGIYSDPPTSDTTINNMNIASYSGTIKLPTSVPSVEMSSIKSESKSSSGNVNPFSDIFPSPFSNKLIHKMNKPNISSVYESELNENVPNSNGFSSNSESDKLLPDDQPAEESSSPRNLQTESTSYKNDAEGLSTNYTTINKLSPSNDIELSNRLRRIGVMNPKAFCEICCKEYCNKYFLRTHKMKRHGIYIPDDKDKDAKNDNAFSTHNMQTSPLNLIMTEQTTLDRKTTSPSEIGCEICGIKFQNASLSQLHNVSVHSKYFKDNDLNETSVEDTKKINTELTIEKTMNAEAISEDLQKLQTMILQLNELDVSKVSSVCNACNKECDNRYYLHAHMMTEHGILLDDMSDVEKPGEIESNSNNNTMCDLCGKDVQNSEEMKKHVMEFHGNPSNIKEEHNGLGTPEKTITKTPVTGGQITERRISMNVTPTSSYCDICNKELCNKYFMKTHMQRMHGIEIENGAQIGGVICDICNKELCSKYFLRVHKHNTHGIVEYGTSLLQPRKTDNEAPPPIVNETDPALKPNDLADLSHRYFTHFTEVCTICSRRFRSTKWLKAHFLSDHGQIGAEKWAELEQQLQQSIVQQQPKQSTLIKSERSSPTLKIPNGGQDNQKVGIQSVLSSLFGVDDSNCKTYQCSFCPFTTTLLPLLFVHERSHSMQSDAGEAPYKCLVCTQSYVQPELLQHHMFTQHPLIPLPPLFNGTNENIADVSKEPSESADDDNRMGIAEENVLAQEKKTGKPKKSKGKAKRCYDATSEIGQMLKEAAGKAQIPATYALPQTSQAGGDDVSGPGYVMQAFLLEDTTNERRVVPAIVFLPVLQKQPAPLTVTFNLTPA